MAEVNTLPRTSIAGRTPEPGAAAWVGPDELSRLLHEAYAPIAPWLAEAERIYREELGSRSDYVQRLVEHASRFRGKQLRPALVLLTAQACGGVLPAHPVVAAVVEMIHTATLVHDDILDEADVRRHAATINAEWGNEPAVLLGDYLFTHAFHLAASLESTYACRVIGRATNLVCEGELQQIHHRGDLDLDEQSYYEIVRGKTAELTAVCCRLGAHYAGQPPEICDALDRFGRDLGVAFQIADDLLDLWGEEVATGKTLGTDLQKQKLTLPVIFLLRSADRTEADAARRLVASPSAESRRKLRPMLESSGALEYAWDRARSFVESARLELAALPASPTRETLAGLAQLVVRRCF
ncbi:polyprenyl synthetase family protein [Tautonia sociabilis]|uniref:Polyprenyl synthetase family protein n=2 Tax=Tautonia sociabilis TaxID=2080755 RepID=A0A432MDX3_9BACT|nr:polyprenyl synthetase family protein [Tautonia sociabilis]RUL83298.1 polyprenyl synthetase family protein [Tautonia sociabilis]